MAEVLTTATYPDAEVRADRERAADETVIAMSQPEVVAQQALRRRLFAGHPYCDAAPNADGAEEGQGAELRDSPRGPAVPLGCSPRAGGGLSRSPGPEGRSKRSWVAGSAGGST